MTARRVAAVALTAIGMAYPAGPAAHRLDEYLQASRISIDPRVVTIELDLTPGASVASKVLEWVDTDGDGAIGPAEQHRYARTVIDALTLSVDGRPSPIRLIETRFPEVGEFRLGVGTIRLRGEAATPAATAGRHHLTYDNAHRPETSAYLVNALVPADRRLTIVSQQRDTAQQRVTIDYDMTASTAMRAMSATAVGVAIVAALFAFRRLSPHDGRPSAIRR